MPVVLVAGKLHPLGRDILTSTPGFDVTFIEEISEASYAPFVHGADAVLIRTQPMSAATIAKAKKLKIVSRHGVGYDALDLAALNEHGIALAICGDVNSISVAEHAAMMILAASKQAMRADNSARRGPWEWRNRLEAQDLCGRNLLLLGYGRIGRHVASMMRGFGVQIRAYDPFLLEKGWPDGDVTSVAALSDGLAWADIISISTPHTGKPLLGAEEFAAMRDGVIIVNTARGGLIDEQALIAALHSGKAGAAGIDVFEQEPLSAGHPLTQFDQVILSPHIAGLTAGAAERMAIGSAQNIVNFFNGTIDPALIVNRDRVCA